MESDIISLKSLYEYAKKDTSGISLHGKSKDGKAYKEQAKALVGSVKEEPGFYLWGYFEKNGRWVNIYIGKAGDGPKTSLRARLLEELGDERMFLWANYIDENELLAKCKSYYPQKWLAYEPQWKRAIQKSGSTHIVWVATPSLKDSSIRQIEADIIETMNPVANNQRPRPESEFQEDTFQIIKNFKHHIHRYRGKKL